MDVNSNDQAAQYSMQTSLPSDHILARDLADAAGGLLCEIRTGLATGRDADEVRREGDRQSHELLVRLLRRNSPGTAVLSEEADGVIEGSESGRLWIIDPLDGTREFGELDRDDWAVHVALAEAGKLVAGAVALPARAQTYTTSSPPPPPRIDRERIRIAVSRTRPAAEAELLANHFAGDLVPMGSAGAKAMAVVSGDVDVYLHSGGQHVWDSAAPVAVATSAGLHASRIDGSDLDYGSKTAWLPDIVICRPELRDRVLGALRSSVDAGYAIDTSVDA
jgi:3'(2'), 5'-bisphosphate nucleotidase